MRYHYHIGNFLPTKKIDFIFW